MLYDSSTQAQLLLASGIADNIAQPWINVWSIDSSFKLRMKFCRVFHRSSALTMNPACSKVTAEQNDILSGRVDIKQRSMARRPVMTICEAIEVPDDLLFI